MVPLLARWFTATSERIAAADDQGNIHLFSTDLTLLAKSSVCQRAVYDVNTFDHRDLVAFSCGEGAAGVARLDPGTQRLIVVDRFRVSGTAYYALPDETGERIVFSNDSNQLYVYDVATRLVSEYRGQSGRTSCIFPGSRDYDHILVGNTRGVVQVWDPPPRQARVLLQGPSSSGTRQARCGTLARMGKQRSVAARMASTSPR